MDNTTNMGPIERLLRQAGELITPDGRVCVGEYAVDANGHRVEASDRRAVRWCALGAVRRVRTSSVEFCDAEDLLDGAAVAFGFSGASTELNDVTDGTLTPDAYSEAIEAAAELGL